MLAGSSYVLKHIGRKKLSSQVWSFITDVPRTRQCSDCLASLLLCRADSFGVFSISGVQGTGKVLPRGSQHTTRGKIRTRHHRQHTHRSRLKKSLKNTQNGKNSFMRFFFMYVWCRTFVWTSVSADTHKLNQLYFVFQLKSPPVQNEG